MMHGVVPFGAAAAVSERTFPGSAHGHQHAHVIALHVPSPVLSHDLLQMLLQMLLQRRYPQMMQALMARFHGHPYDTLDLLPYNVVDPVKKTPLENLWAMGHNRNELVGVI